MIRKGLEIKGDELWSDEEGVGENLWTDEYHQKQYPPLEVGSLNFVFATSICRSIICEGKTKEHSRTATQSCEKISFEVSRYSL